MISHNCNLDDHGRKDDDADDVNTEYDDDDDHTNVDDDECILLNGLLSCPR